MIGIMFVQVNKFLQDISSIFYLDDEFLNHVQILVKYFFSDEDFDMFQHFSYFFH